MVFIGIDIGKLQHVAGAVDEKGKHLGKTLKFPNTSEGFAGLKEFIESRAIEKAEIQIGMEATGHYWMAIFAFLHEAGYGPVVFNPLKSDALRNMRIRKTKTDPVDAFLVADVVRMGDYIETHVDTEEIMGLRNLTRFRMSLVGICSDLKRKALCLVDQVFPEYENLFSDVFGESSKAVLMKYGTPGQLEDLPTHQLARLLEKASRGRFGTDKAIQLKTAAKESCGVRWAEEAFIFEIRMLVQQIEFTERQIDELDKDIAHRLGKINTVVTTIPGVGPTVGAVLVSEIGDISRFETPAKLVAFAGIDPSVHQSGSFLGTHGHMSKRGSPYLRTALWHAAFIAIQIDPVFKAFFEKKRAEGKPYGVCLGAAARKLTHTVHAIMKANRPYEARPPLEPHPELHAQSLDIL